MMESADSSFVDDLGVAIRLRGGRAWLSRERITAGPVMREVISLKKEIIHECRTIPA
jgi:hypothetical protein